MADRLEVFLLTLLDWAAQRPWRGALLVALVALAVIVPGQSSLPVTDRDEGRFVQASKQMVETGDLIDIRLQDAPRWKKPAGIYWLQAGAATLFGGAEASIWAYRLPSALAGVLAALLTLWAARPLIGPQGAVLAGLMMAVSLLLVVEAHIAKTDAALAVTAIAALGAMAHLLHGQGGRAVALVFWVAIAAAILLKGPIVPVIAAATLIWTWGLTGTRPAFGRFQPLQGGLIVAALVAPWLIAIWIVSDGAFFAESLGRDMGAKLTSGQEAHWGPPGLYAGIIWGTLWPWAALIPLAGAWLWTRRREAWAVLLAGWVVPFWIVLEAVPTKLPHYVLPLYPALVIALAAWAQGSVAVPPRWSGRLSAVLVALPAAALCLAVLVLPVALEGAVAWAALPLVALAAVATWIAVRAALDARPLAQVAASLIAAAAIYPAVLAIGLPMMQTAFPSPRLAALITQYQPCASGPAFSVGYGEPSLVFQTYTALRLDDGAAAMDALAEAPGTMVLIETNWRAALGERVPQDAVARARHSYFNYNRGKMFTAELLTRPGPRWDACAAGEQP